MCSRFLLRLRDEPHASLPGYITATGLKAEPQESRKASVEAKGEAGQAYGRVRFKEELFSEYPSGSSLLTNDRGWKRQEHLPQ